MSLLRPPGGRVGALSAVAAAILISACTSGFPDRVPLGNWGGPNASMVVSDTGAEIQYDCGAGRITVPMLLDSHGDFDLPGIYIREGPGPVSDSVSPLAARYVGHAAGHAMSFTMTVENDSIPPASFTVTYGGNPVVLRCL